LQVGDIDAARMMVHVHRGKGAKDRYVPLPSSTLRTLRQYWVTPRHPVWLFPATGRDHRQAAMADEPMDRTSVQGAMEPMVEYRCGGISKERKRSILVGLARAAAGAYRPPSVHQMLAAAGEYARY
jgi:integrase